MKKNMNLILRKCKSLSRQLGRSNSYTSLRRSDSAKFLHVWGRRCCHNNSNSNNNSNSDSGSDSKEVHGETIVYVGSKGRRYVINSEFLSHPLLGALIDKSGSEEDGAGNHRRRICIRCEVVFFDYLLWMLENDDDSALSSPRSIEELADLYAF